jgi:SAM-dependent methyltransferase
VAESASSGWSGWPGFLADYHARHPAITEDLLRPMRGPGPDGGLQPYAWLTEGLLTGLAAEPHGLVWDVCCGSAPVADVVGLDRYAGVDLSQPELDQAAARRPGAHVVVGDALTTDPPGPVSAVTVAMALMLLPLQAFLDRAADLLPPGGRLHAMVPTRENAEGTGYGHLLQLLGQTGHGYRQHLAPDAVAAALDAAGFGLVDDQVAVFHRPVTAGDVDLVASSFYLRHGDGDGPPAARAWLAERATTPGWTLDYPLRRIRAVRR